MRLLRIHILLQSTLMAFRRCSAAVAAIEYAFVMPLLVMFMLAGAETARYVSVSSKIAQLANAEAGLLAERTSADGAVTPNDLIFIQTAAMVIFPRVLTETAGKAGGWYADMTVTLSSIQFTPTVSGCTSNCTYTGNVVFSLGQNPRACGVQQSPVSDTATPTSSSLPADVFTSGSLVVVDVIYHYVPIFGSGIIPSITLRRSAYLQPRYVSLIKSAFDCSGY